MFVMLSRAKHLAKSLARNVSEILHFVQDDNISANRKPRVNDCTIA